MKYECFQSKDSIMVGANYIAPMQSHAHISNPWVATPQYIERSFINEGIVTEAEPVVELSPWNKIPMDENAIQQQRGTYAYLESCYRLREKVVEHLRERRMAEQNAVAKFLNASGHDLCHENRRELADAFGLPWSGAKKPGTVNEFDAGCKEYQRQLYGRAASDVDNEISEDHGRICEILDKAKAPDSVSGSQAARLAEFIRQPSVIETAAMRKEVRDCRRDLKQKQKTIDALFTHGHDLYLTIMELMPRLPGTAIVVACRNWAEFWKRHIQERNRDHGNASTDSDGRED